MKNFKYLFLLMIGLSVIGCSDLIEEPVGVLSPDGFFQEPADIQTAVDGSLTHAINEEIWGRKLSIALMLRSDMVDLQSSQTRRVEMNEHTISGNNEMVYDPWRRIWLGIGAANFAIAGAEGVDAAEDIKNPIIAQAYFARAFYYFHLVRLFGDIPYFEEPIIDAEAARIVEKLPAAEVYENILADLEYAKTWLPNTVASRSIPSKAAASSYIALVYLTMAGNESGSSYWKMAFDEAKEVIDNAGTYDLALDDDFQTLFNATKIDASKEPIFALDYNNVEAEDNAYDQIAPMCGIRGDVVVNGWSVAVPSMAVYESFDELDYRRAVSFQTEATIKVTIPDPDNPDETITEEKLVDYTEFDISGHEHAANRPYMAKFSRFPGEFARSSMRATSHNYSMLRYAEVLLIAAEAAVEIQEDGFASMYLNMVRERARKGGETTSGGFTPVVIPPSTVPADITGGITVEQVLEERRVEFAFESKRWYDIKRRQLGDVVFSESGYEGLKPEWNASEDYLTPIPEQEVERNPNLGN